MAKEIYLMYCTFMKVRANGALILGKDFMMNIFLLIILKVPQLKDFLDWYCKEKSHLFIDYTSRTAIKLASRLQEPTLFILANVPTGKQLRFVRFLVQKLGTLLSLSVRA